MSDKITNPTSFNNDDLIALVLASHQINSNNLLCATVSIVANSTVADDCICKSNGHYMRKGDIPHPKKSFWNRVLKKGDDLDFFHYLVRRTEKIFGVSTL